MGVGDLAEPVDSSIPANHPVPKSGDDRIRLLEERVATLEKSGSSQLAYAVRYLFDLLSEPYPPP